MNRFRTASGLLIVLGLAACGRDAFAPTAPRGVTELTDAVRPANADPANVTTNAVYTITNPAVDPPGSCFNGSPVDPQNCNIYAAKEYVWIGGKSINGPNGLANGTYFFSVLEPGGQPTPNDGAPTTLSDVAPTSGTGAGDAYTNRTFTITDGEITYGGSHTFANGRIRLFGYDDTPNPGGVYILAVCSLARGYPVDPSRCKFDAFKVKVADQPPCTENCGPTPALDLSATKTAAGTNDRKYAWSIAKAADKTVVKTASGSATFTYTVTATRDGGTPSNIRVAGSITVSNPNDAPVAITGLTDVLSDGTPCAVGNVPATLAPGPTVLSYSCDLQSLPTAPLSNTVEVYWTAQTVGGHPLAAGSAVASVDDIRFTETAIDGTATVTDPNAPAWDPISATTEFTYSKTFENNAAGTCTRYDNTATFTTNSTGATGSASKSVQVCVGANLTASKTATPSFTRTYNWGIAKAVDKTVVKQVGGSATFNYTVNASQTGSTDSNWQVAGVITVNNPNDWEAVTVNVSDVINNGGTCTVTGGSNLSVPASGSVTASYACTYAAAPSAAAYTNTATATWNADDAATPGSSAVGTMPGEFGAPTTIVNGTVTVQDTFNGTTTVLGTLTASDAPPAAGSWTYSHVIPVLANTCLTYNNTAAFTQISGSASRDVTVCGNVAGGLTIGYWQNKNGQAIISTGAATATVCNSGTWLRQYAPFQDLSTTATCAQVASYAMNVIKAASAAGAAMNAMLKAQMLATAFDVYFSTPSLGGNKINAPAPIGGINVDLTMICSSIGACSSTYANVSAAFGGALAKTVSELLAYAASQSNAGGSIWYGQIKATQELAKNTFDAINNAVALVSP